MTNTSGIEKRQAATEHYAIAKTINTVFDRCDELRAVLAVIASTCAGADPVRAARDKLEPGPRLVAALEFLVAAAVDAAPFRSRAEISTDIDTKSSLLFAKNVVGSRNRGTRSSSLERSDATEPADETLAGGAKDLASTQLTQDPRRRPSRAGQP